MKIDCRILGCSSGMVDEISYDARNELKTDGIRQHVTFIRANR
jgi:hypothetical protein